LHKKVRTSTSEETPPVRKKFHWTNQTSPPLTADVFYRRSQTSLWTACKRND